MADKTEGIVRLFKEKKNFAISIDGGGFRGIMVARALMRLENYLSEEKIIKETLNERIRVAAGTSTGSIIAACITQGTPMKTVFSLYRKFGKEIFGRKVNRNLKITPFYKSKVLRDQLALQLRKDNPIELKRMNDLWKETPQKDLIITALDLRTMDTRFIKPWNVTTKQEEKQGKIELTDTTIIDAVLASCAVPVAFPMVTIKNHDFADGGVGAYGNPTFIAAFEICNYLTTMWGWKPEETAIISIGTGKDLPISTYPGAANKIGTCKWIKLLPSAFSQPVSNQQLILVSTFFPLIKLHRFQLEFKTENIEMDDVSKEDVLINMGDELANKIITDDTVPIQTQAAFKAR